MISWVSQWHDWISSMMVHSGSCWCWTQRWRPVLTRQAFNRGGDAVPWWRRRKERPHFMYAWKQNKHSTWPGPMIMVCHFSSLSNLCKCKSFLLVLSSWLLQSPRITQIFYFTFFLLELHLYHTLSIKLILKITIFLLDRSQFLLDPANFHWICLTVLPISRRLLLVTGNIFAGPVKLLLYLCVDPHLVFSLLQ